MLLNTLLKQVFVAQIRISERCSLELSGYCLKYAIGCLWRATINSAHTHGKHVWQRCGMPEADAVGSDKFGGNGSKIKQKQQIRKLLIRASSELGAHTWVVQWGQR